MPANSCVDFQDVGYGSAASTMVFFIVALCIVIYLRLSRSRSKRDGRRTMKRLLAAGFAALVAMIVAVSLFPFYYALVSSLTAPARIFEPALLPHDLSLANYIAVFRSQPFGRNILNSVLVASLVVLISLLLGAMAAYAFGRVRFRGRALLISVVLGVSMFPQVAILSGMFELVRVARPLQQSTGTVTRVPRLHSTLHHLGAHYVRAKLAGGNRRSSPARRRRAVDDADAGLPAPNGPRGRDQRPARLHRGLERVPVRADLHID